MVLASVTYGPSDVAARGSVILSAPSPLDLTVITDSGSVTRRYAGEIVLTASGDAIVAINVLDVDAYVASVLASEVSRRWQQQALHAAAIATRTYWRRRAVHQKSGAAYDVTDGTSNQVYRGLDGIVPAFTEAAASTSGLYLEFDGEPADVWYHSSCGGHTAGSQEVTGFAGPPYLLGVADLDPSERAYCADSPYYRWRNAIDAASVAKVFGLGTDSVSDVSVTQRWPDVRVKIVTAASSGGSSHDLDGHIFYSRASATLGYKVVPSAMFSIERAQDGSYVFTGNGVGHGVGLCQWGAQGRANAGANAAEILGAYFPGTIVKTEPP